MGLYWLLLQFPPVENKKVFEYCDYFWAFFISKSEVCTYMYILPASDCMFIKVWEARCNSDVILLVILSFAACHFARLLRVWATLPRVSHLSSENHSPCHHPWLQWSLWQTQYYGKDWGYVRSEGLILFHPRIATATLRIGIDRVLMLVSSATRYSMCMYNSACTHVPYRTCT